MMEETYSRRDEEENGRERRQVKEDRCFDADVPTNAS